MGKIFHWHDCAIHSGPAYWPQTCDCGGFRDETGSEASAANGMFSDDEKMDVARKLREARRCFIEEHLHYLDTET